MKLRLRSGKTLTLIAYYFLQWETCNETITVSITCDRMYFAMMQSVSHCCDTFASVVSTMGSQIST